MSRTFAIAALLCLLVLPYLAWVWVLSPAKRAYRNC